MATRLDRMLDSTNPATPSHRLPRLELVSTLPSEIYCDSGDSLSQAYLPTEVCSGHQSMEQQLCRWLLLTLDRLSANEHTLTQAASMLGVCRDELTEAANMLHQAGFIRNRRGYVTVLDHTGLADHAQRVLRQNRSAPQFSPHGISICRT